MKDPGLSVHHWVILPVTLDEPKKQTKEKQKRVKKEKIVKEFPVMFPLDKWPIISRSRCLYDGHEFETKPVFIPKKMQEGIYTREHGVFCGFPCAILHIVATQNKSNWRRMSQLTHLYNKMRNAHIGSLPSSFIDKHEITSYDGKYEISIWRKLNNDKLMDNM